MASVNSTSEITKESSYPSVSIRFSEFNNDPSYQFRESILQLNPELEDETNQALESMFSLTIPWSPQIYFTTRGAENAHIYFWIAKDLCWTQGLQNTAITFGSMALIWCGILMYNAIFANKNMEEAYILVALTGWVLGNFVWMKGEVINNDDAIGGTWAKYIFSFSLAWILLYHLLFLPLGLIKPNFEVDKEFQELGLHSRFSYFKTWKQYEYAHILCWLGKDWAWNLDNKYIYTIFAIFTLLLAGDFVYLCWKTKKMTIDLAHFVAQFIWVSGNIIWAASEVYGTLYDDPQYIFRITHEASITPRWYSSWVLFFAYVPIYALYIWWLPLTLMGKIAAADIGLNNAIVAVTKERQSESIRASLLFHSHISNNASHKIALLNAAHSSNEQRDKVANDLENVFPTISSSTSPTDNLFIQKKEEHPNTRNCCIS